MADAEKPDRSPARKSDGEGGGFVIPPDLRIKIAEARLNNARVRHSLDVRRGRIWNVGLKEKVPCGG